MSENNTTLHKNLRALSLLRIALSVFLLSEFVTQQACCFYDFYGEKGILPLSVLANSPAVERTSYLFVALLERAHLTVIFPIVYPAVVILFGIGFRTRWTNLAVFLLSTYLTWRNPHVIYGADILARLLLLWCLFLPMNRYWSVDAALDIEPRSRTFYSSLPFVAIQAQVCSVYTFAALVKLSGGPWREGQALALALSDNMFGGTVVGLYVVNHFPTLLYFANFAVIIFQLSFPLLVYCPWRNNLTRGIALALAAIMHISFMFLLNIGTFPYISLAALLVLVPDGWINRLIASRRAKLDGITLYYEANCHFCQKVTLIMREFFLARNVPVLPASCNPEANRLLNENRSWLVCGNDGGTYLKSRGFSYILSQSMLLIPLGLMMRTRVLTELFDALYDVIGRRRRALSSLTETLLPFRTERRIGRTAVMSCGFLALLGLSSNIYSVVRIGETDSRSGYAQRLFRLASVLQVAQRWYLFAPVPTHFERDFKFILEADDGSTKDLNEFLGRPIFRVRKDTSRIDFAHHRWLKYLTHLVSFEEEEWQSLGSYLCQRTHKETPGSDTGAHYITIIVSIAPVRNWGSQTSGRQVRRTFDCHQVLNYQSKESGVLH